MGRPDSVVRTIHAVRRGYRDAVDKIIAAFVAILEGQGVRLGDLSDALAVDVARFCCGLPSGVKPVAWADMLGDKASEVLAAHKRERETLKLSSYSKWVSSDLGELEGTYVKAHGWIKQCGR